MRALPKELMNKPNGHLVMLDGANVTHRLVGRARYQAACGRSGTPTTLAQAVAWSQGWCSQVTCWSQASGGRGSR